jgi:hypothetical protein
MRSHHIPSNASINTGVHRAHQRLPPQSARQSMVVRHVHPMLQLRRAVRIIAMRRTPHGHQVPSTSNTTAVHRARSSSQLQRLANRGARKNVASLTQSFSLQPPSPIGSKTWTQSTPLIIADRSNTRRGSHVLASTRTPGRIPRSLLTKFPPPTRSKISTSLVPGSQKIVGSQSQLLVLLNDLRNRTWTQSTRLLLIRGKTPASLVFTYPNTLTAQAPPPIFSNRARIPTTLLVSLVIRRSQAQRIKVPEHSAGYSNLKRPCPLMNCLCNPPSLKERMSRSTCSHLWISQSREAEFRR